MAEEHYEEKLEEESKKELAVDRTDWAKERAYTAWIRTGLASLAGIAAPLIGFWSYRKSLKELEKHGVRGASELVIGVFTGCLFLGAVLAWLLILLR